MIITDAVIVAAFKKAFYKYKSIKLKRYGIIFHIPW